MFKDAVLHQNKCNAADVDAFLAACFTTGTSATCDAFIGTATAPLHGDCVKCLLPEIAPDITAAIGGTLPTAVLIPIGDRDVELNSLACEAALSAAPSGCSRAYADTVRCLGSTCGTCAPGADLKVCRHIAATVDCLPLAPTKGCDEAIAVQQSDVEGPCGVRAPDFDRGLGSSAATMCGP